MLDVGAAVRHQLLDDVDDHLAPPAHRQQALVREAARDQLDEGRREGEQHQERRVHAERERCADRAPCQHMWTLQASMAVADCEGMIPQGRC